MPYEPDADTPLLWDRADALGVARVILADLSGVSASRLSRVSNGAERLSYPEHKSLDELLTDLEDIQKRARGIPVDWKDRATLRDLIAELRRERSTPAQPLSDAESALLRRFSRGEPLNDLLSEADMEPARFLEYVERLIKRTTRLADLEKAKAMPTEARP